MTFDPLANTTNQTAGHQLLEGSGHESVIVLALQECQAAIDAGESIDRKTMLEKYPDIRDELSACLDGLELMRKGGQSGEPQTAAKNSQTPISPLATLGDFRILCELGRGGMGVVYEAEQLSIGRRVALKVLPYASMLDKRQIARFQNEARAAATLEHPHIVPVYFVGNERGVYYYAMRLIEGRNLSELLVELRGASRTQAPLSQIGSKFFEPTVTDSSPKAEGTPARSVTSDTVRNAAADNSTRIATDRPTRGLEYFRSVASIGQQAADALDFAHSHGIVHRDIKPANIMLDQIGDAWIADFGLARIESDGGVTVTGDLIGTLRYMSPEQTLAKRISVDHRSDVYSLGATLYELVTLRPLFEGDDRASLLRQIAFQEPQPPSKITRSTPHDLETIILKALRKNPEDRYATARDFADDLQRFLSHEPVQARRTPLTQRVRMWARRHPTFVAATTIVCTISLISLAAIGLLVARHERDARTKQQEANEQLDNALGKAEANLKDANIERGRAEANLALAIQAVEETYLNSIGEDRLLRIGVRTEFAPPLEPQKLLTTSLLKSSGVRFSQIAQRPTFTDQERNVVRRGLEFYDQIARLNPTNPQTQFQSAKAFSRLALLHGSLDENGQAQAAYEQAITRLKSLTEQNPDVPEYFVELARAYYQQGRLNNWWPDAGDTFNESITSATQAIQIGTSEVDAYRLRGRAHLCLHQYRHASSNFEMVVELQPQDAKARFEYGQSLEESGDLENAVEQLQKCVELEPANRAYRKALASLYRFGLNDRKSAGAVFEPLLESELTPLEKAELLAIKSAYGGRPKDVVRYVDEFNELGGKSFETYWLRARSSIWLKNIDQAESDLQAAMELATTDQEFREVADQYKRLGNHDEQMLVAWERAEELNPNNYEFYKDRGFAYYSLGEYQKAINDFKRFIRLVPQQDRYVGLFKHLGRLNYQIGNYDESLSWLERSIQLNPKDPSVVNWIDAVYRPEEFDPPEFREAYPDIMKRAIEQFTRHIQEDPSERDYWHNRGTAFWELRRVDEAISDFLQAIRVKPESAYSFTMLARVYREKGLSEKALESHTKAIAIDPKDSLHLRARADTHKAMGKLKEAISDYEACTRLPTNSSTEWYRLGILYQEAGRLQQALNAYTVVLEREPFSYGSWINRGNVYKDLGNVENAISDYSEAIRLNSTHPLGWQNRSIAYRKLGQYEKAIDNSRRLTELHPDNATGWHEQGVSHFHLKRYESAIANFSKAVELGDPSALRPHAYLLCKLDRADEAIPLLRKYLQFEQGKRDASGFDEGVELAVIEALRNLAYTQLVTDRVDGAFKSLREAVHTSERLTLSAPDNAEHWALLGRASADVASLLSQSDQSEEATAACGAAQAAFEKAMDVDSHPSRLFNLAGFLLSCPDKSLRDPPRALQLARQCTKMAGEHIHPRASVGLKTFIGIAHYQLGEWRQALDAFEAIEHPLSVSHRYHLAMTHWKMGNENLALGQLKEAIETTEAVRESEDVPIPEIVGWNRLRHDAEELMGIKAD